LYAPLAWQVTGKFEATLDSIFAARSDLDMTSFFGKMQEYLKIIAFDFTINSA